MSEAALVIDLDFLNDPDFPNERRSQREAYLWLGCMGPQKLSPRRFAAEWRWDKREVLPFIRKMVACGTLTLVDGIVEAVALQDAVRHPEFIVGESWRNLRLRVFVRDGFACTYCGGTTDLHCDHIFPRSRGGLDVESNLTTACGPCNLSKGARTPEEWRP